MNCWKDKTVIVVGAGKSGIGSVELLHCLGAKPVLFDENKDMDIEQLRSNNQIAQDVAIYRATLPEDVRKQASAVVMSPGVPVDTPFVDAFKNSDIPVIGEIELAYSVSKGRLIAITGTNGKTTTTTLVGEMVDNYYHNAFVVGNIGNPYTKATLETTKDSITIAEISSFQLETMDTFHPQVSAILNITPDHLNRHHTMDNYVSIKQSVNKNQSGDDVCVLNYEDPYSCDFAKRANGKVVFFSSQRELADGYYLKDDVIYEAWNKKAVSLINIHEMHLLGIHNAENVMAAIAIGRGIGIPMDSLLQTIRDFKAVEHRIEYVTTKNGVDYYNDSKGTNPDAAIKGIQAMNRKTVLIGGGYDKDSTYDEWIEAFDGKVTALVLLGQTKEKIAQCARKHGFTEIIMVNDLQEAVKTCASIAQPKEAVLLSPACASWGMFPNYEVRGKMFKEYVNQLEG